MNPHHYGSDEVDDTCPLPHPTGAAPGVVAIAWPTGRRIYPYTAAELARGVDAYTCAMKAHAADANPGANDET